MPPAPGGKGRAQSGTGVGGAGSRPLRDCSQRGMKPGAGLKALIGDFGGATAGEGAGSVGGTGRAQAATGVGAAGPPCRTTASQSRASCSLGAFSAGAATRIQVGRVQGAGSATGPSLGTGFAQAATGSTVSSFRPTSTSSVPRQQPMTYQKRKCRAVSNHRPRRPGIASVAATKRAITKIAAPALSQPSPRTCGCFRALRQPTAMPSASASMSHGASICVR